MSNASVWGDHIALQTLTDIFNVYVKIINTHLSHAVGRLACPTWENTEYKKITELSKEIQNRNKNNPSIKEHTTPIKDISTSSPQIQTLTTPKPNDRATITSTPQHAIACHSAKEK